MITITVSALGELRGYLATEEIVSIGELEKTISWLIYEEIAVPITEKGIVCTVNGKIKKMDYILNENDKVIFFKPVGGG